MTNKLTDQIKSVVAGNNLNIVTDALCDLLVCYSIIIFKNKQDGENKLKNNLFPELIKAYNENYKYRETFIKEQTIKKQ